MKENYKIAILGCGNLGLSIVNGLLSGSAFKGENLTVTKRHPESLFYLQSQGITVLGDNAEAAKDADLVLLGVKPYNVDVVLNDIKPVLQKHKQVIVSLAAGITISNMQQILEPGTAIFRVMPNIAADIKESITCICGQDFTEESESLVKEVFDSIGVNVMIEEHLMEAATVLGACGIAFVFRFMRAMTQGGIQIGFDAKTANKIVTQTVKGASELIIKKGLHPEAAIDKVTTPKGSTIVGLNEMEHHGFSAAMVRGMLASYNSIAK
jgi:pyrroline-5-carboxylate reductase